MSIIRYFIVFLIVATFVAAFCYIAPLYQQYSTASTELKNATFVLEQKRSEAERLARLRVGLQNNPAAIEKTARERYGYSREGEYVTNIIEE